MAKINQSQEKQCENILMQCCPTDFSVMMGMSHCLCALWNPLPTEHCNASWVKTSGFFGRTSLTTVEGYKVAVGKRKTFNRSI